MSGFYFPGAIEDEDEVGPTSPLPKRRKVARPGPSRDAFLSHGSWTQQDQAHIPLEINDNELVQFNGLEADVTTRHVSDGFDNGARLCSTCDKDTLTGTIMEQDSQK